jgi:chorismate dehydratase
MEKHPEFLEKVELSKDIPAECARKLLDDEVDLGLVPVAIIPKLKEHHIISDYCIGAIGKVHSVLLVSDVPVEQIESIYLDYQSRTSVQLCKLLAKNHWQILPKFLQANTGYETKIEGKTAGVIIGDRTFNMPKKFQFQYDLAEEWMKWQKLPFVFAAWVSNKELPTDFIEEFNQVLTFGLDHKKEAIDHFQINNISPLNQLNYLENSIKYELDSKKKEGLDAFLKFLK